MSKRIGAKAKAKTKQKQNETKVKVKHNEAKFDKWNSNRKRVPGGWEPNYRVELKKQGYSKEQIESIIHAEKCR